MKYLQVMPTDGSFIDSDSGSIIVTCLILIGVIILFDRVKVILSRLSKKKTKQLIDENKPLIERLIPDNEFKRA